VKFSAVLLSWKRPQNLSRIVDTLHSFGNIDEIFVWNNAPEVDLKLGSDAIIFASPLNFGCFARFAVAALASNDNLWFQDDDLLVSAEQFKLLQGAYALDKSRLYGAFGRNLVNGRYEPVDAFGQVDIVLGRTIMMNRGLLHHAFEPPAAQYVPREDDIHLSLQCRRKHFAVRIGPVVDMGSADPHALSLDPQHLQFRQDAVDRCLRHFALQPFASPQVQLESVLKTINRAQRTSELEHAVQREHQRAESLEARIVGLSEQLARSHHDINTLQEQLSSRTVRIAQKAVVAARRLIAELRA
jgi:hypothetical protein